MAKIAASHAAALFEEILGWPYVSPGSNDQRGIDCSGAWVRVYRQFGLKIDHSSNSQFRRFCSRTGKIADGEGLQVGMAVFKVREWQAAERAHRDYGGAPGNLYHVGCVASIHPLRIVHATPDFAKADTAIGKWAYWGMLKEVDYRESDAADQGAPSGSSGAQPLSVSPAAQAEPGRDQAKVITTTTGLMLRKLPEKRGVPIKEMPIGTIVEVLQIEGAWARVRWKVEPGLWHDGWCCIKENETDYLRFG